MGMGRDWALLARNDGFTGIETDACRDELPLPAEIDKILSQLKITYCVSTNHFQYIQVLYNSKEGIFKSISTLYSPLSNKIKPQMTKLRGAAGEF